MRIFFSNNCIYSVSQKIYPLRFSDFFSKRLRLFKQNLKKNYTPMFISTANYKISFNYL